MSSTRTFRKSGAGRDTSAEVETTTNMISMFDSSVQSVSSVRAVVTYTDSPKRSFGLAWSLLTGKLYINTFLMNKHGNKAIKEGDWIEAVVVWNDNWMVKSMCRIEPLVETIVEVEMHSIFLEVKTTVVVGAVQPKYAICYSELFGRVVVHYESPESACDGRNKLEWGAMFNATLAKQRCADMFGCEWTAKKLVERCDGYALPLTMRYVHATVGELVDDLCAMTTDDGDVLAFEKFVYLGSGKPKPGDRVEAYVCRDMAGKMRAVGVRPAQNRAASVQFRTAPVTNSSKTEEETAQLLHDLESVFADCATDDASSDDQAEPEQSHQSEIFTNEQKLESSATESSDGSASELNSKEILYYDAHNSGNIPAESLEMKTKGTPQDSTSSCRESHGQNCRAKALLSRVMECDGMVELVAKGDPTLMADLFHFVHDH